MNWTTTRAWCLAGLLLASGPGWAQKLQPEHSEITFSIRQFGVPVEGRFTRFGGQLAFDPQRPEAAKVTLHIDTASARFGAPETDAEVSKPEWFNAPKFPQATLDSTLIKAIEPGKYAFAGKLTIKGAPRDIIVPVSLTRSGSLTVAAGTVALKRLDFKIGEGDWSDTSLVANEVQVRFKLALADMAPF